MKKVCTVLLLLLFLIPSIQAQDYTFNGSMSRRVMENYLDRSVTMAGLSEDDWDTACSSGPCERDEDIDVLIDIGAKFIGRTGGWWGNGHVEEIIDWTGETTAAIKARDPEIICQAAMFEYISDSSIRYWTLPATVQTAFGIPNAMSRKFDPMAMHYPDGKYDDHFGPGSAVPDITQQETQLWFFYLATSYIDRGIEALHFGQMELMDDNDPNHVELWGLLQKIRDYASTRNRGVVLIDAHVGHSGGLYYEPGNVDVVEQLVFDFHSAPVRWQENTTPGICLPDRQPVTLGTGSSFLYQRSGGGWNPQGWYCDSNPFIVEVDNSDSEEPWGCGVFDHLWGWDEIGWFGNQEESYRNDILIYSHFKVKCLDPNGRFQMPVRRTFREKVNSTKIPYRARTGNFNQQSTIKAIWSGAIPPSPNIWTEENFTRTQVINFPQPPHVFQNLLYVGDDQIYYIGTDLEIHGYVRNGQDWTVVHPSAMTGAAPAIGNLTANPSGTALYYRSPVGFVHRIEILPNQTYSYAPMETNGDMLAQNIRVDGDLICATDDQIYYAARELNNNQRRIHGLVFTGGEWRTTSPSHSAGNVSGQVEAAGELVVNPDATFIVYRGVNGLFYRFDIQNIWNFTYSSMNTNINMLQQNILADGDVVCSENNRIYYIAMEADQRRRIHGLIFSNGSWTTTSPSYASSNTMPAHASSQLIVSSAAATGMPQLAYVGEDQQFHGFKVFNDWFYPPVTYPTSSLPVNTTQREHFVFSDENQLYYTLEREIYRFIFQRDNCQNPIIDEVEKTNLDEGNASDRNTALESSEQTSSAQLTGTLKVFPNPTDGRLTVDLPQTIDGPAQFSVFDQLGRMLLQHTATTEDSQTMIDLTDYPAGLYWVRLESAGSVWTAKVVRR